MGGKHYSDFFTLPTLSPAFHLFGTKLGCTKLNQIQLTRPVSRAFRLFTTELNGDFFSVKWRCYPKMTGPICVLRSSGGFKIFPATINTNL
ncbi:hypothetical protein M5D96_005448 [Drosophila gunungcola]|uniref:Uncharacterized protein n=1 Tax=Drosophila gunungcola TaxID=103775 RepID=A0A9Q0BRJ7_9MUSC|nr:hypothetical protein M5D96_005448 [Drosophila gunungcola]